MSVLLVGLGLSMLGAYFVSNLDKVGYFYWFMSNLIFFKDMLVKNEIFYVILYIYFMCTCVLGYVKLLKNESKGIDKA